MTGMLARYIDGLIILNGSQFVKHLSMLRNLGSSGLLGGSVAALSRLDSDIIRAFFGGGAAYWP